MENWKSKFEYKKKPLLRDNEIQFFKKLQEGLNGLLIFSQVSMNAVLDLKNQKTWRDREHFWSKIIDFVVCAPTTYDIIAIIELDGPSHDSPENIQKDLERDEMLKHAGYIVKRYDWRKKVDEAVLNKDFRQIIQKYNLLKESGLTEKQIEERFKKMIAEDE